MSTLSLGENYVMCREAFFGTVEARRMRADKREQSASVADGIQAINRRWPDLAASTDAPIFAFGAGWRTGSTLLQRLIMDDDLIMWGEPYNHCALVDSISSQLKAFNAHWPWPEFFIDDQAADNLQNNWVANLYPDVQRLREAHTAYFNALFGQPAAALGKSRWGVKEVLLNGDHAVYLKWLYPNARFVFLIRNPYSAWASYRPWRRWYRRWPDGPVHTPTAFGRLWRELTADFIDNHEQIGGLLVRYEDLATTSTQQSISDHLGRRVTPFESLARVDGHGGDDKSGANHVPRLENMLLAREVEPLASKLDYARAG